MRINWTWDACWLVDYCTFADGHRILIIGPLSIHWGLRP
jgi:hypothetical protein